MRPLSKSFESDKNARHYSSWVWSFCHEEHNEEHKRKRHGHLPALSATSTIKKFMLQWAKLCAPIRLVFTAAEMLMASIWNLTSDQNSQQAYREKRTVWDFKREIRISLCNLVMGKKPRKQHGLIAKKYARPLDFNVINPICQYQPEEKKNRMDKTSIDWLRMWIKQIIEAGLWALSRDLMAAGFQAVLLENGLT